VTARLFITTGSTVANLLNIGLRTRSQAFDKILFSSFNSDALDFAFSAAAQAKPYYEFQPNFSNTGIAV